MRNVRVFELHGGRFDGERWMQECVSWPCNILRQSPDVPYALRYQYRLSDTEEHVYRFVEYVPQSRMATYTTYDSKWGYGYQEEANDET